MPGVIAGAFGRGERLASRIRTGQASQAAGVRIGFWRYFAVGAPLTLLSILAGLALL